MQETVDELISDNLERGSSRHVHYGIWILIVSVLTNFGAIGLGRFAIGMVIPKMGSGLHLSNTQLGVIVSAMFLGYLGSTVVSGTLATRIGPRRVIATAMLLVSGGMVIAGIASGFWMALAGQLLIGTGAGGSNVPTLGLVNRWFAQKYRGTASGIVLVGSGLGFALAGILIPYLIGFYGDSGWRASWFYLSAAVFSIALLGALIFRNDPHDLGLYPIGSADKDVAKEAAEKPSEAAQDKHSYWKDMKDIYLSRGLWELGLIYFMFGFSYVIFTTFFAKYLVEEIGVSQSLAGEIWFGVGLISLVSGFLWGLLSDKIGRKNALFIIYMLQGLCLLVLSLTHSIGSIAVESVIYALTLWSIPSIMSAACADYVGGKFAPAAIGMVTIFFGVGQVMSPWLGGYIKDITQSFSIPFMVSAGANIIGALLAIVLPKR